MFSNLSRELKKVVIIFIVITLTYSNFVLIGTNVMKGLFSYALDDAEQTLEDKVTVDQELITNKVCEINKEQKRVIQIAVTTGITEQAYPIKTTSIILKTNIIGETLEDVKVTSLNRNSYTAGTWEIKEEKLQVTLVNENEALESKELGLDKLLITYVYSNNEENSIEQIEKPIEQIAVQTYSNESVTKNIETTNFEDIEKNTDVLLLNIENRDIHKTTITEGNVEYTEKLNLDLSYRGEIANIKIEDASSDFYNNNEELINEEANLKYLKTKINKNTLLNMLGTEGKLTITDIDSNKVLTEITKEYIETQELNKKVEQNFEEETTEDKQTQTRAYITITEEDVEIEYELDVNKIQIKIENILEQSDTNIEESNFVIENTKSIFGIQDLDKLNFLKENVKYTLEETEKTVDSKITFKDTITRATLESDKTELTIGEANKVNYTITLDTQTPKSDLFVNPVLLIELPSSVTSVNSENSEFSIKNDNGVFTNKEVFITTVLGKQYVAIMLTGEQTAESVANGNTQIILSLELNVKAEVSEKNETAKLYYQNNTVTAYESGTSFDTSEVDVTLVLKNEEKEEIVESTETEEGIIIEEENERADFFSALEVQPGEQIIKVGEEFEYLLYLNNTDTSAIESLIIEDTIPEGLEYVSAKLYNYDSKTYDYTQEVDISKTTQYNKENKKLNIEIQNFEAAIKDETVEIPSIIHQTKLLKIKVKANSLETDVYSKKINNEINILKDGVAQPSNSIEVTISEAFLNVSINTIAEKLKPDDEVIFEVTIKNLGLVESDEANIEINFPDELKLVLAEEKYEKTNTNLISTILENEYNTDIKIPAEDVYTLKITAIYSNVVKENKNITVKMDSTDNEYEWNTRLLSYDNIDDAIPSNPEEPDTPQDPSNPDNPENPNNSENPDNPNKPENPENPRNPENEEKFDLSLKQYLNKVTVENSQGITTYDYTNTNFAKVEIPAKYMNGSKVTFEYKIIVKNEGTISGYARKIVDYLPKDLTFSEEQNKDWYVGEDGNIYSVALIDKLLEPGDSEELTIILTKQMNNNNTGTVTNIAEIYEASNDENVEDINSIPGDKLEDQNDMSKVEVILAVRTGTIILYILLIITVITIIGIGIYKVKKITLNRKEVL